MTPELLAPVGSWEALTAAVRCGADAVYFGAGRFHARQASKPFADDAALLDAIAYCHQRGVQVHLTLNTLVRETEMAAALAEAERAAGFGVDALIVQDRGLARAIRAACPSLSLHASTQLSCHTPEGVKALFEDGFSRVVLAREMSRDEIAACVGLGPEIEVFVHGALCMSVSGQCFFSAALGGRSGNRGRCAQTCRLPFCTDRRPGEDDRALSLKDLSLVPYLPELAAMGVKSFKIEGRMKRPEYVAAATAVCRAALDGRPVDETLASDLRAVFSRSGFTDGYYTARRDLAMFGARTKDDVQAAAPALKRLQKLYEKETARLPLSFALTAHAGQPLTLTAEDGEHTVTVTGETADGSREANVARLTEQLQKLGGTPFAAEHIEVDADASAPVSAINALRRQAVDALLTLRAKPHSHPFGALPSMPDAIPAPASPALWARLQRAAQIRDELVACCERVIVPLDTEEHTLAALGERAMAEIPRGIFGQSAAVREALGRMKAAGVTEALCHTIDAVAIAKDAGLSPVGGFGLHAANAAALAAYREDGVTAATLSTELSLRHMAFAACSPLPVGAVVYGRQPLMLLRNCPHRVREGCGGCPSRTGGDPRGLYDRKGVFFPLVCQNGCPDLVNSVPLWLADQPEALRLLPLSFWMLSFTTESAKEAAGIAAAYARARQGDPVPPPAAFTRGLTAKGAI